MTTEENNPFSPPETVGTQPAAPNWTTQDDLLRTLWHENKPPDEIAGVLGRSVAAVMTRAARLGLPRRAAPGRKRGYKRPEGAMRERTVRVRMQKTSAAYEAEEEKKQQTKTRICLMCLKKFESEGPHNRICPGCKGSAEYATGSSTPDFVFDVSS